MAARRVGSENGSEGAQIAALERLDIENGGVNFALARRLNVVVRESLVADTCDMRSLVLRLNNHGVTKGLQTGIEFF
jgi:hypothetical protein